jgi:hypothetical protein
MSTAFAADYHIGVLPACHVSTEYRLVRSREARGRSETDFGKYGFGADDANTIIRLRILVCPDTVWPMMQLVLEIDMRGASRG